MTPELRNIRKRLIDGMVDYMTPDADDDEADSSFDPGYTQAEIDECGRILDDLLSSLEEVKGAGHDEAILKVVHATIERLNELNERSDCALIETEQREDLCELINTSARQAGLKAAPAEDITEEWREW